MSNSLLALLFTFEAAKCGSFANHHIADYIIESDLVLCNTLQTNQEAREHMKPVVTGN